MLVTNRCIVIIMTNLQNSLSNEEVVYVCKKPPKKPTFVKDMPLIMMLYLMVQKVN